MKIHIYKILVGCLALLALQACDKREEDPCTSCGGHAKSCQLTIQEMRSRKEIAVKAFQLQKQCGMSEEGLLLALEKIDKDID